MNTLLVSGLVLIAGTLGLVLLVGPRRFSASTARAMARFRADARPYGAESGYIAAAEALPAPVKTWLLKSGALEREPVWLGRITQQARMRTKPEDPAWREATALQYTRANTPAFIWTVKMPLLPGLRILGRDSFLGGKGQMRITLNGLISLVHARGSQIDEGSLQRYLGEIVWFPSLATLPEIRWEGIDSLTARATLKTGGTSGSATFHFDEAGDFVRFEALRYRDARPGAGRYPWVLTVQAYRRFEGVRIPSRMQATWRLPGGDWTWLELEISDLKTNEAALEQPGL